MGGDWVSACRNVEVAGEICRDRGRNTLEVYVDYDILRDMWRDFISGQMSNHSQAWKNLTFKINDDDDDDDDDAPWERRKIKRYEARNLIRYLLKCCWSSN